MKKLQVADLTKYEPKIIQLTSKLEVILLYYIYFYFYFILLYYFY